MAPSTASSGRRVVYRSEDLEVWLESHVARNTTDADARLPNSLTGQQHVEKRASFERSKAVTEG